MSPAMNRTRVEGMADELLAQANVLDIPINLEEIAQSLGLVLQPVELGDSVSGLLVLEGEQGVVGYNQAHHEVRRRFTIAHEIGHYLLHRKSKSVFIDKRYTVYLRSTRSSTGEDMLEVQANQFAAALLMPREMVQREIASNGVDVDDERTLVDLAHKFNVSTQAMAFRLANLGLLAIG